MDGNNEPGQPDSVESLSRITRAVGVRWRLERMKAALSRAVTGVAAGACVWAVVVYFRPSWIVPFPWAAAAAGGGLIAVAVFGWLRPLDPRRIHHGIDQRLALPDSTLSSGELAPAAEGQAEAQSRSWIERQQQQTLSRLGSRCWSEVWPAPWPQWSGHAALAACVALPLLGYLYAVQADIDRRMASAWAHHARPNTALTGLFKDWEEAQKQTQDEDLKQFLEKIAPLRERLTNPQSSEQQLFADLNRLEEVVTKEKARLEAQSLEPEAGKLADALEPVEGMSALAAALRRKDFGKAEQAAEQARAKLAASGEKIPAGAKEASEGAARLSKELDKSGKKQMSQALGQFGKGASQGDSKKMAEGMQGMKEGMARQNARDGERRRLATQLSQLGFCKDSLGECKNPNASLMSLMPRLAMGKQKTPGHGAGSETAPDRFGEQTRLNAGRNDETLKGTLSEGESETTTLKSAEGQAEASRATASVNFQAYEKLSQQAIEDENIPAAHRQVIKRYFEKIRPDAGK